jgi:D-sedoheptulose 7-phosphate isomerase
MTLPQPPAAPKMVERGESAAVRDHFAASIGATRTFFAEQSEAIAQVCQQMARRFERSGTLLVFGEGAQASDAAHAAVEFVHPVLVGKRALPAVSLAADPGVLTGRGRQPDGPFAGAVRALGTNDDIALALCAATPGANLLSGLDAARERGLLTVLLAGEEPRSPHSDWCFAVPHSSPLVVQEVHETLYHVFWELVHVFFDDRPGDPHAADGPSAALHREIYPFLRSGEVPADPPDESLFREVSQSTRQKSLDICALRAGVFERSAAAIAAAATAVAERFASGGRLLAFGNGGSATDAQDASADCMTPPVDSWRRLPALALANDVGVVTGVANDVGYDHVFARQVLAFGRPQDIALGISTSGASRSVIRGMEGARKRGLLTIALSGNDGGALAESAAVDHCLIAGSDYVPRIQEAHATIWHALLGAVQSRLASERSAGGPS